MVSKSKIVTLVGGVLALSAVALVGYDDHGDDGDESIAMVTVVSFFIRHLSAKVFIAYSLATAADALVSRYSFARWLIPFYWLFDDDDDSSMTEEGWSFPRKGWIKCNVDGSAPPDKLSGCGGVFRDSNGSWLYGFARSFHRCDSSAAELEGIYTGLDIAWKQGFRRLILETDSLTSADVVNNKNGASARIPHEKKFVQMIKDLLENRRWDGKPMIVHSNRDGNKVADWLADLSHGLKEGDQLELSKFPDGCRSCQELMLQDTRLAKAKAGRSYFVLVMFLFFFFLSYVVPA